MLENYSSDLPISDEKDDRFQRYNFAKRIASTIIERDNSDCIVIGIYGVWGEGKTSVINFIASELKKNEHLITIKFNPWRYQDEISLLIQFFETLAHALDAKIKTKGEAIGSFVKKYGKVLSFTGFGESIESAGAAFAEVDIDELKKRIEKILVDNKSKIVIFIDDIDRLDKSEIHSVFRLVKLTADFKNTTYILSFDDKMVSSAIGERFGEGNQNAGQNFLEKIIQVPLHIPKAQKNALNQFCLEIVENILNTNQIKLTEEDAKRYTNEFTGNILPRLETPRLAVRYGNSLTFSLPLLLGEVNLVDLLLIEAIKTFYPEYYNFIKSNPEYFIESYGQSFGSGKDNEKITSIKEQFNNLAKTLTKNSQKRNIQNLLEELFPLFNEVYYNHVFNDKDYVNWFKNKRIVSSKYFERYFTYSVIKGDISDITFDSFIRSIKDLTVDEIIKNVEILVKEGSPDSFIQKLRSIEMDFDWDSSKKIAQAIAKASNLFPKGSNAFFYGIGISYREAATFIYQVLKKHKNIDERLELAKNLMTTAQPFRFAYELNSWFRIGETPQQRTFSDTQYAELATLLIERIISETGNNPFYETIDEVNVIQYLIGAWYEVNKNAFEEYFKNLFTKSPNRITGFLNSITPTGFGGAKGGAFKSDFTKEIYHWITTRIDKRLINDAIHKTFSEEEVNSENVLWIDMGQSEQSDLNLVRQFQHWLKMDTEPSNQ